MTARVGKHAVFSSAQIGWVEVPTNHDGKYFTLCLDDAVSGCNREGRGEPFLDADGERTQYLGTLPKFLKEYQTQFRRARAFCTRLTDLGPDYYPHLFERRTN